MSLALRHGLSKRYEQLESRGNEGMVLIHQVMGRDRASDTFKRSPKTPKNKSKNRASIPRVSQNKPVAYNIHTNQQMN